MTSANNNDEVATESSELDPRKVSKKKPIRRMLLIGFLLFVILVAIAPNLIGWTGSLNRLTESFVELDGKLQIGSASLGWFQKITLNDVILRDDEGQVILKVESVQSTKSLLALVMHQDQLGEFKVAGADVALITWPGGSNLEKVLEPIMVGQKDGPTAGTAAPQITIDFANCRISLRKENEGNWQDLRNANGQVKIAPQAKQIAVNLQTETPNAGSMHAAGQLDMDFTNESMIQGASGEFALNDLDCTVLGPVLYRLGQKIDVSGKLSSRCKGAWSPAGAAQLDIEQLLVHSLVIDAPDYLSAEPVKIEDLLATGAVSLNGLVATAKQLAVKSECGVFEARGTIDVAELMSAVTGQGQLTHDFQLNGRVDVAALTRAAPGLMNIRDDVELVEAKVDCEAFSRMENGQRRLLVNLELPTLTARRLRVAKVTGQRPVLKNQSETLEWKTPIRLTAVARQDNAPLWLELLTCESDFLLVNGSTQPNGQGQLTARGDLGKLKKMLEQFFDLSQTQLSGSLTAQVDWSEFAGGATLESLNRPARLHPEGVNRKEQNDKTVYRLVGNCVVDQFNYAAVGQQPIREDQFVLKFDANYAFQDVPGSSLESARLEIVSGADLASATLLRPLLKPGFDSVIMADIALKGTLTNWLRRIHAFVTLPNMNLQGELDAAGLLTYTPHHNVTFASKRLQATEFEYQTTGVRIREPRLVADTDVEFNFDTQRLSSKITTLAGSAVSLRADNTVVDLSGKPETFRSALAFGADLQRTMAWFDKPNQPNPYLGKVSGKIDVLVKDTGLEASIESIIEDFKYVSIPSGKNPSGVKQKAYPLWTEKKIALGGRADYQIAKDALNILAFRVQGDGLNADGSGRIDDLTNTCRFNLAGTMRTDVAKLAARLRENYGLDLQMSGQDEGEFVLTGPLFETADVQAVGIASQPVKTKAEKMLGRARVLWRNGAIYGVPFGQGKLAMQLDSQQLAFEPIDLPLNSGSLAFEPAILFGDQYQLTVKAGKIVNQAELTPQICREWLKYVNPLLAEATEAKGKFSVDLKQDAVMPLSNPLGGSVDCDVTLYSANVGPGPVGRQIVAIAEQVRAVAKGKPLGETLLAAVAGPQDGVQTVWLEMPEQIINCQVRDGRVYHNQMTFQVKDIVIQTSGSVGADQTIDLVATIPIRPEWVADQKLLAALTGNVVRIPIKGTMTRFSIGKEALAALPKQFLQNAAGDLLKDKSGQFLKDAAGKLLDEKSGKLLKGINDPDSKTGNSLEEAAGKLLEDRLQSGLKKLIGSPKKK